jgi:glycosyltransferase involved in cell wall biosynthesis
MRKSMSSSTTPPRLSVVVPTYQGEEWVTDCLDSLAAQTLPWEQFEVLLVQNGPATRTAEIVEAWSTERPGFQLVYLTSEGAGVSPARNLGLDEARGEYVTFVDDDDRVGPHMLEALLSVAAPDVIGGVLIGHVSDGDYDNADFDHWYSRPLSRFRGREGTRSELCEMLVPTVAKVVRTEIAREIRFDETLRKGQDVVFWVSVAARHRLRHVAADAGIEAAYYYNQRRGSLRQYGARPTWENNVAARVQLAAVLAAIPISDPEVSAIRDAHYRTIFRVDIRAYLRAHPHDRAKVLDAARDAGVPWIPWNLLNRQLARELALIGALEPKDSLVERLVERGVVTDVLTYATAEAPPVLSGAEPLIDRHLAVTGPRTVTWDLVEQLAARAAELVGEVELGRGAPYSSVHSSSAGPLEHLVAGALKIGRPEWRWTAELLAGARPDDGADAPVEDGPIARRLRAALATRGVATARLETLGALAEALVDALADAPSVDGDGAAPTASGADGEAGDSEMVLLDAVELSGADLEAPPSLSVILPTHRGDEWIGGCLDALAAQTLAWDEFEVVVVANGPRTGTPEIVAGWLTGHPGFRLKLIVTEQAGVSRARNLGLEAASGRYVTFVDDDDLAGSRMLEALVSEAAPGVIPVVPVGFVTGAGDQPDFDNWFTRSLLPFVGRPASNEELHVALVPTWAKLVGIEVARAVRWNESLQCGEDRDFWMRVIADRPLHLRLVSLGADATYLHRRRGASLSVRAGGMQTWDKHVEPWLAAAEALQHTPVNDPETGRIREQMVAYVVQVFVAAWAREHPEDRVRLDAELGRRGLPELAGAPAPTPVPTPVRAAERAPESAASSLTVIVPTYRGVKWIRHCLDSLAAQTLGRERFEIVVVRNGPDDGTARAVHAWRKAHPDIRLTLTQTEVAGAAHARNVGLDLAGGDYVTFVDDDDRVAPRYLESLLASARPGVIPVAPIGMVRNGDFEHPDWNNWLTAPLAAYIGKPATLSDLRMAIHPAVAKVVDREIARAVRFEESLELGEDTLFWLRVLVAAPHRLVLADFAPDAGYLYQWREGSQTMRVREGSFDFMVERHLDAIAAIDAVETSDAELIEVRGLVAAELAKTIRLYLVERPQELARVDAAIRARHLADTPWQVVHQGLATTLGVVAADATAAQELVRRGELVDVLVLPTASDDLDQLAAAEPIVDRLVTAAVPELSWAALSALAGELPGLLGALEQAKGRPYDAVVSVSASPLEHLVAALLRLFRPEMHWHAVLLEASESMSLSVPGDDELAALFAAGIAEAGHDGDAAEDATGLVKQLIDALAMVEVTV